MYIFLTFLATIIFLSIWQWQREKAETVRFREFVIANKSKNLEDYTQALPNEEELPQVIPENISDLTEVEPEELLTSLYEDK